MNTESHTTSATPSSNPSSTKTRLSDFNFSKMTITALILGIGCGIFFGEYCESLSIIGDAFVGLLRMTVMPYIVFSLIANLGKLPSEQVRRLAFIGGGLLLGLWTVVLFTVFALAHTFPEWKSGSFFSTAITDPPREFDFLSLFIPSNIFKSLANNDVPAVVLLCICIGIALSGIRNRDAVIAQLDVLAKSMVVISGYTIRLAPIGIFAIAASTSGTISYNELGRLQAYLITYTFGAVFLGFIALPLLVTNCTTLKYRDVIYVTKDAMVMAFATGKLLVVLPLLIEKTERLFEELQSKKNGGAAPAVDVLYPIAYTFPHTGKLLSILFIPFAAWFLGNALTWAEYPTLLIAGLFSYFGGPILAIPFLLDLLHLPHDMFQLFLLSGVYGERIGDALGAIHLATFTLLTTCFFIGEFRFRLWGFLRYLTLITLMGVSMIVVLRMTLHQSLDFIENKQEIIANMHLLEGSVPYELIMTPSPNPDPLFPRETLINRIHRRGIIRIGYNEDNLPFAFFNGKNELVGFDINLAHALARDLGVKIEFVRYDREWVSEQLEKDHFDIVMSGLVGTLERSQTMQHTAPYMDVTLSLVVHDHRAREFRSMESLRRLGRLRIGFVDLSSGFVDRLRTSLPDANFVEIESTHEFFDSNQSELDALLISAESGSAFTLLHPEYEVVVPAQTKVSLPLFYGIGARDVGMQNFLEYWLQLRKKDGTVKEFYNHWILGKHLGDRKPRWCIIRDVLHWVD